MFGLLKGKLRLKIGNKIFGGFIILIALFSVNAAIIFITVNKIDGIVHDSAEVVDPSRESIEELLNLVQRSRMLITNWVFLLANQEDKDDLEEIINPVYPQLKNKINSLMNEWVITDEAGNIDSTQKIEMIRVLEKFDSLLTGAQENIMSQLQSFDDYEDPSKKFLAGDYVDSKIIPESNQLTIMLSKLKQTQTNISKRAEIRLSNVTGNLRTMTLALGFAIIFLGLLSAFLLVRSITVPINAIREVVVKLGKGELVGDIKTNFGNDEIGEMAVATENLVSGLKATTLFAETIGHGKYDSNFNPLSSQDVLGNALINMRDNLQRVSEDDKKRTWITEGLAKFGEILRRNTSNIQNLSDEIISNTVKYLNANQGAFYLIDEIKNDEPMLSMVSCYAWDKKKFLNEKVHLGEGLVGQAWQEKDIIFLTEVPDSYIKITSGLGDANPTCLILVPLMVNEEVFGIIELASFNVLRDFEIEFLKKIAESIASTVSSVRINARTQKLLEESQEMTEQMKAQEEEMRQNMEELQATQEEMHRSQSESENLLKVINDNFMILEYDQDGIITKANQNFTTFSGFPLSELVGEHHRILVPREERGTDSYRQFWRDLIAGKPQKRDYQMISRSGKPFWIRSSATPLKSSNGAIKVMEIGVNISMDKNA